MNEKQLDLVKRMEKCIATIADVVATVPYSAHVARIRDTIEATTALGVEMLAELTKPELDADTAAVLKLVTRRLKRQYFEKLHPIALALVKP